MEWKQIEDLMYEASSEDGQIRNIKTGRILKQRINRYGYYITDIQIEKKNKTFEVHRLIAKAFLDVKIGKHVDHIDRNRKNNNLTNLRVVSVKENMENREFKLTDEYINKIIRLHEKGLSTAEIRDLL